MNARHLPILPALSLLLLASLACRPVMTVGWQELLILVVVIAVLLGPTLFKLYRRLAEFQSWKADRKPKDKSD